METVHWMKPRKWNVIKDWYLNNSCKSQVSVAHSFWVICQNVSHTIVRALFGEAILVYSFGAPIMATGNQQNHLEFTFSVKALSFHSRAHIRAHKHINKSQEERPFSSETAFLFWCHALWKLWRPNCCILEMKHATGLETWTKIYFLFIFNVV